MKQILARLPGVVLATLAALLGWWINRSVPLLSPLLVALVLGVIVGNLFRLPERVRPGLAWSAKTLLRAGVVLLGLQISFGQILALGPALLLVVCATTFLTFFATLWFGRRLGVGHDQSLLVAAGCSICGAAAIAGVNAVVDADEEEVATSVGIITFFGLLAIPAIPLLAGLLHLPPEIFGAWAGGSIHEVAQVVAAAGTVGGTALTAAVVVKLTRVLMLAPMAAGIAASRRRNAPATGKRPPLVPLFVLGFIAAVALRSLLPIPAGVLDPLKVVQTMLLAVAMFGLGAGVGLRSLITTGGRTIITGAFASVFIAVTSLGGILLVR